MTSLAFKFEEITARELKPELYELDGISRATIEAHYKLYQGYVNKRNEILGKLAAVDLDATCASLKARTWRIAAVSVGVTTLKITVPTGVFGMVRSFCVQRSEPGAAPGHTFTVWAWAGPSAMTIPAVVNHDARRICVPLVTGGFLNSPSRRLR